MPFGGFAKWGSVRVDTEAKNPKPCDRVASLFESDLSGFEARPDFNLDFVGFTTPVHRYTGGNGAPAETEFGLAPEMSAAHRWTVYLVLSNLHRCI